MTGAFRTKSGGRIDRNRTVSFTFDGKRFAGFVGDTLASALIANGVHLVGRSFKYHRPRGFLAVGSEEPNALVKVDRGGGRETPNLRATQVELYDGLAATSQNRWPSLAVDVGAASGLLSPLFPAGFQYKTFMGPRFMGPGFMGPGFMGPRLLELQLGLEQALRAADPPRRWSWQGAKGC